MTSPSPPTRPSRPLLWRLYISHALSTWNARTFEFGAVIFLGAIFPGTLFFASCYALFRSAAAAIFGSWIGHQVDRKDRLYLIRQSIIWQRLSVAASCLVLHILLRSPHGPLSYALFSLSVVLACFEKLAFVANTVAVERDWLIVVSESLHVDREKLNSTTRRIDLICKLVAPVGIGFIDGYSTEVAIYVVFAQNAISVAMEYFAIAQVYAAIPELARAHDHHGRRHDTEAETCGPLPTNPVSSSDVSAANSSSLRPWLDYLHNPAFLASFSLSILYFTVLSFSSQMVTYLLTLGYKSEQISVMRLVSVFVELSATCAAPWLMKRIGVVRSGLWFINQQLFIIALAIGLFSSFASGSKLAGGALVLGVCLSRLGLWGFDLCVQFLVQKDAPEASRGSFSAIEMSLQNFFELLSFATTMIFYRPEDFQVPIYISGCAMAISAVCFAAFARGQRGHLLHTDRCWKRMRRQVKYQALPTIDEEVEMDDVDVNRVA